MGVTGIGIGVGIGPFDLGGASAFSPLSLFAGSEEGAWYDPSDLSTLWQDSAGTTPVTATDQPVGRIDDKSGNGNHAIQSTAAARPLYKTSGGLHWLEFDGIDDRLTMTYGVAVSQPNVMAAAFSTTTLTHCGYFGSIATAGTTRQLVYANAAKPRMFAGIASPEFDLVSGVATVGVFSFNGASSAVVLNAGTPVVQDSGSNTRDGVVIGSQYPSSLPAAMKWWGHVEIGRSLTSGEQAAVEAYLAQKSGVTL